jgi:hypothetical protein
MGESVNLIWCFSRANALERFIPTEGIKQGVFVEHSSTNTPDFTVLRVYISEKGFVQ